VSNTVANADTGSVGGPAAKQNSEASRHERPGQTEDTSTVGGEGADWGAVGVNSIAEIFKRVAQFVRMEPKDVGQVRL
jgi:hypothetical protein